MSDLEQLLEVQQHDTRADQLRHKRVALPERGQLTEAQNALRAARAGRDGLQQKRGVLAVEQDRLEADIEVAKERIAGADRALYGGTTANPRELQALQDEIASLTRRVSLLEDEEIGVMEQIEPIDAEAAAVDAEIDRLEAEIERLGMAITAAESEIDVELDGVAAARAASLADVPESLVEEYERLRGRLAGVAVARLSGGQCGGCHLRLSAVEFDRIKRQPPDALVHCEECGRLLVH